MRYNFLSRFEFALVKLLFNIASSYRREFYEDFASALRDGVSNHDRLKKLYERSLSRGARWSPLYEYWLRKMKKMSFANALQHTVPAYEVMVLTAAEEEGRLSEAMDYVGRALRLSAKIRATYFAAMLSPLMGLLVIGAFVVSYALLIAPELLQALPLDKWPIVSKTLYVACTAVVGNWALSVAAFSACSLFIAWTRPNWRGRIRNRLDKVPVLPWKSFRDREGIAFLVSLSIMLRSNKGGLRMALEKMKRFASPWLSWHLHVMSKRLELAPNTPARALDTGLFSLRVMDRIEDYSDRTEFNKALYIIAFDQSEKDVQSAQGQAALTAFVTMLTVAVFIGLFAYSSIEFNQALEDFVKTLR